MFTSTSAGVTGLPPGGLTGGGSLTLTVVDPTTQYYAYVKTLDARVSRTFRFGTGRIGVVYDLTPNLTPYASFTNARDPGGSGLFVVNAGQNFAIKSSAGFNVSSASKTRSLSSCKSEL